jgi:hypothetical protein
MEAFLGMQQPHVLSRASPLRGRKRASEWGLALPWTSMWLWILEAISPL